jgi:hypothetical protein
MHTPYPIILVTNPISLHESHFWHWFSIPGGSQRPMCHPFCQCLWSIIWGVTTTTHTTHVKYPHHRPQAPPATPVSPGKPGDTGGPWTTNLACFARPSMGEPRAWRHVSHTPRLVSVVSHANQEDTCLSPGGDIHVPHRAERAAGNTGKPVSQAAWTTPAPTSWYRPWLGLGPNPRSTGLSGQWSEDGPHLRLGPQRMALACGQEPSALAGMPVTLRGPPARV